MKNTLLEKMVTAVLNNEETEAAALFHKYLIGHAKKLHESLRQNESVELGEGWDDEIHEEEYFGDDDVAVDDETPEDDMSSDVDMSGDMPGEDMPDDGMAPEAGVGDEMGDDGLDDVEDMDMDAEPSEEDMASKMDNIESKLDDLTAEFERLMGTLEDTDPAIEDVDDDSMDDDEFEDVEGEEPGMETGEANDLADRMDSDLSDEDKPESETMEDADFEMGADDEELDEDLADITESVMSELEKISMPSNTEGSEIGSGGKKNGGNPKSVLPNNPINSRIEGAKPVMTNGPHNDSFEREEAPARKPVSTMVSKVRNGAARNSFKDTMSKVPANGDGSALLNSDFAGGGEAKTRPPVDGRMKPRTK